jgi:hypothetical protein
MAWSDFAGDVTAAQHRPIGVMETLMRKQQVSAFNQELCKLPSFCRKNTYLLTMLCALNFEETL